MIIKTVTFLNEDGSKSKDIIFDSKSDFKKFIETKDMSLIRYILQYSSGVPSLVLDGTNNVVRS